MKDSQSPRPENVRLQRQRRETERPQSAPGPSRHAQARRAQAEQIQAPPKTNRPRQKPRKRRFPIWSLLISLLCTALLVRIYVFADEQLERYHVFNEKRAAISGDTFYGNVFVDGVPLRGLTKEEARGELAEKAEVQDNFFFITIASGVETWRLSAENIPLRWDTEAQLEKAYMIGRTGTLEERYAQVRNLNEPVYLTSEYTYDRDAVRQELERIAAGLAFPSENAAVVAFDPYNRSFGFSQEKPGQGVETEKLIEAVLDALDRKEYGRTMMVETYEIPAEVTNASLAQEYGRISTYTTMTTANENRNTNIRLAAEALNGSRIASGDTISFNEITGERSADKGYLKAGAIENGRTVEEYGGGVCQVSTTLFNALVRANCDIVKRKPHAWPSNYVPYGEDATVDWPGTHLIMKNPTDTPMFVVAWYENQQVTVEIYGKTLSDNKHIDLESEIVYTKKPTDIKYTYDSTVALGSSTKIKEARTGYTVQTYKIWYQDGIEISREPFYKSDYPMISEEYVYNDGNPPQ